MNGIAYSFSPDTGEDTGPVIAQESPRQPGNLLRPKFSTFDAPPETGEREIAVFAHGAVFSGEQDRDSLVDNGGEWSVQIDYRSVRLYSTADGSPRPITEIGIEPDDTMTEIPRPSPSHVWSNGEWLLVLSAPLIPQSVSRAQGKAALFRGGYLPTAQAAVDAAVAAGNIEVGIFWNEANTFERGSPFVSMLADAIPLTDAEIDDLFILADSIGRAPA